MRATLQKTKNGYGLKEMVAFVSSVRPEHRHQKLSLKNCQAIEFGFDLDALSYDEYPVNLVEVDGNTTIDSNALTRKGFYKGFQKALEIWGDHVFTEKDMLKSFIAGAFMDGCSDLITLINTLNQTEWEVEVEMEADENQCDGCKAGHKLEGTLHVDPSAAFGYMNCQKHRYQKPKLDAAGCLILKRV